MSAVIAVTTPEEFTVNIAVLSLYQAPPVTSADKLDVVPKQAVAEPETLPASGNGFIVKLTVVTAVPQTFVNE